MNVTISSAPNITNVYVHALASFPKNFTTGNVQVFMNNVPQVANIMRKMLKTERSY